MELTAVVEALKFLGPGPESVVIVSDAKYVTDGATMWLRNWKARGWRTTSRKPVANREVWEELNSLATGKDVHWVWIRHASLPDHLATVRLAHEAARRLAATAQNLTGMSGCSVDISSRPAA